MGDGRRRKEVRRVRNLQTGLRRRKQSAPRRNMATINQLSGCRQSKGATEIHNHELHALQ